MKAFYGDYRGRLELKKEMTTCRRQMAEIRARVKVTQTKSK